MFMGQNVNGPTTYTQFPQKGPKCIWGPTFLTKPSFTPSFPRSLSSSDGLGRTGTFCTLYYVLDRVKTEQVVDVFQAVKTLRIQRTGLVDNLVCN